MSVGRLGIITKLTLNIVPQQSVRRTEQDMTIAQFAQQVKQVQDAYTQAKQSGSAQAVWTALHSLNETQVRRSCARTDGKTSGSCVAAVLIFHACFHALRIVTPAFKLNPDAWAG